MFSYLRYFSAISLIIVFIAAYGVGVYFRSIAASDQTELVSSTNNTLAQTYVNTIWNKYAPDLKRFSSGIEDADIWLGTADFKNFQDDTRRYFEDMKMTDVTLYTYNGQVIFSQTKRKTNEWLNGEKAAFEAARAGTKTTLLLENQSFTSQDGRKSVGTIVETLVPIISANYIPVVVPDPAPDPKLPPPPPPPRKVDAVIALQFNVTPQSEKLGTFQMITTFGIIFIFCILITVLFLSSRRAEAIIAKQHELNLELAATAAAAEAENRDKSQFLANISHELRTPLNAIIGFSEILKIEPTLSISNQHREYLDDIHGSGKHLLSLINDILDYSKAEAGKLEVDVSEIDAIKMVKNSMRLVIPRAESAQVTLIEDLPPKHFVLQTDAKKLKQVLLNILSNAVKFTPAGGEVRVSSWQNTTTERVVFEIKDTGIGIAQKDIARVMTPFGQVDSTLARRYEGTGLGLPLSKKLVEVMGGHFEITSEVNRGTTVTLSFPRIFDREAAVRNATAVVIS